jgi:hypothetical protein
MDANRCIVRLAAAVLFAPAIALMVVSLIHARDARVIVEWPSRTDPSRSLQETIDGAPEGVVVRILAGVYELSEPIWIQRNVTLVGSGPDGRDRTELVRPLPSRRDPIVDATLATGVLNVIDSSAEIGRMLNRGSDAGIVSRDAPSGARGAHTLTVRGVVIRDTQRGMLLMSTGKAKMSDTKITDVAWNGIAMAPPAKGGQGTSLKFELHSIDIFDFGNADIVYIDDPGVCDDEHTVTATILGGGGPGILAIRSGVCVRNSHIALTTGAGILAISAAVLVEHSKIYFPLPLPDGRFGDGIVAAAAATGRSVVTVYDNEIKNVARAYLTSYGSDVTFNANEMACHTLTTPGSPGIDLDAEEWLGFPFNFSGSTLQCNDQCPALLGLSPPSLTNVSRRDRRDCTAGSRDAHPVARC